MTKHLYNSYSKLHHMQSFNGSNSEDNKPLLEYITAEMISRIGDLSDYESMRHNSHRTTQRISDYMLCGFKGQIYQEIIDINKNRDRLPVSYDSDSLELHLDMDEDRLAVKIYRLGKYIAHNVVDIESAHFKDFETDEVSRQKLKDYLVTVPAIVEQTILNYFRLNQNNNKPGNEPYAFKQDIANTRPISPDEFLRLNPYQILETKVA